jgi:peroxiredoxin
VDVAKIRSDPRFDAALSRQLSGWVGHPAPAFELVAQGGTKISLLGLRGKVILLYVWFTGCPPCMKETTDLVKLFRDFSSHEFTIVGANTDQLLHLPYDDVVRSRYIQEHHVNFPIVEWTKDSDLAYGGISIYPTLFLIDRKGIVSGHWIGYVRPAELRQSVEKTLQDK